MGEEYCEKKESIFGEIPLTIDSKWTQWMYNVTDEYKGLSVEEIKTRLAAKVLSCAVFMSQIEGDFNFSNVIRTANAFNLEKVFYYGKKRFDRRGCVGTYHYVDIVYLSSLDEVKNLKDRYFFVGLENNLKRTSYDINTYVWKNKSMILIGEEQFGLPGEIVDICDDLIQIPMFGSVRSFNAATAAAIAIDKLSTQLRK